MFIFGIVFGAAAAGALLYFVPVVDQGRERSIISVQPNGGNSETFFANLPEDRIFAGAPSAEETFPEGVDWPGYLAADTLRVELFKLRNADNRVVGVASRVDAAGVSRTSEWVVHLPARGSLYFLLDPNSATGDARTGRFRSGTREFADMTGTVSERFLSKGNGGRLELSTVLTSSELPEEIFTEEMAMTGDTP